jgi:hypothetical protein
MSWIRDFLSSREDSVENTLSRDLEQFPRHIYSTAFPIVVRRQELDDLAQLLEVEETTPDAWKSSPFLDRESFEQSINDTIGESAGGVRTPEKTREEVREIIEHWRQQLSGPTDAVWATVGTEYPFMFYIWECEARAEAETDDFEEPEELDVARRVLTRIETARESNSKLAIVHKRDLPLKEPDEDTPTID